MKRIAGIAIIVIIVAITAYLIIQIPRPVEKAEIPVEEIVQSDITEEWLGIFIQGQRIGYSFTKIARAATGLTIENRSLMTLVMMTEQRTLQTHTFAHTDNEYTLKDFFLEITTAGHATKIEGTIHDQKLTLTSYSHGVPQTQTIILKEKPYIPDALEQVIMQKNLKAGDEISIPYFDPTTQSSSIARIRVGDQEVVNVLGTDVTGMRVDIDYMGIHSMLWLDENYTLIKESVPAMGMEMIPMSREQALAEIEPAQAFDLLSFFAVKLNTTIPHPTTLSYLKLSLEGISIEDLDIEDDFQHILGYDPVIVESYRAQIDQLPEYTLPSDEHTAFLEPSVYIQCRNDEIINAARDLVRNEKNATRVAEKLVHGVYRLIKKNPTASLPSALDVLRTKEGDCNEHSILFTALARSVGLPTKIYVGLVNLDGSSYFYHAWCAVWLGKWVPVDPTFDQFPADVGHLKLKEGELAEQAKVLQVVGKLRINVLEYVPQ
ncbi:hypothetical protein AMJ87_12970 [candidate division WOR_3 bacterium SM23_60]|uniref:Transglutaminase-like domain-containing protein n=1 Tax=candidate division WOR_3 bacterium SM23_60 TaxID=1703780 RepID=A0A0S8G578_UNCW3|nr:MAG: hypothetical protein AMJ87_12970 [candidate division WOR_3 bacterium SM23_60]